MAQKRLRTSLARYRENHHQCAAPNIVVTWKPFQIDPGTNVSGERFADYCQRRWGGSGWTHHLRQEGSRDGAHFANWQWWPNTLKGHQWIQFGTQRHGAESDTLNDILFTAMYEQGINISLIDSLLDLAKKEFPDWNSNELRQYLESTETARAVQREIDDGRRKFKIRGVPYFVIGVVQDNTSNNEQGRQTSSTTTKPPYGFSGAQKPETFDAIFEELYHDIMNDEE